MNLKFLWNNSEEEVRMDKKDADALRSADWVFAADFLRDVIFHAEELYAEVLKTKNK
jgi:hypothetical protein